MRAAGLVVLAVAVACGESHESYALKLFSKAEVQASIDDLMRRIDANRTRVCPAPHVRDPVTPGPSTEPLAAFVHDPDIAACVAKLDVFVPGAVVTNNLALVAADGTCGAAIAAKLATLASYTDGCSPFQPGVHPEADINAIHIAQVAAFHARLLDPAAGVQASLDALRVLQDYMRGHVNLLSPMIAAAAMRYVTAGLDDVLATATLDDTDAAMAALDALITSMPRFGEFMAGEHDGMELLYVVPPLMPTGWTPPGGWPDGLPIRTDIPRDEAAAALAIASENFAALAGVCGPDTSYAACVRGFAGATTTPNSDAELLYTNDIRAHDAQAVRARMRASLVARQRELGGGEALATMFTDYAKRLATSLARLAAVRIHLEVTKTGACPTASQLTAAPWSTLAAPAALGDSLELRVADGKLEMRAPRWTEPTDPPHRSEPTKWWSVPCH